MEYFGPNGTPMGKIREHFRGASGGKRTDRGLTPRQEQYACNRANGMSQSEAFLALPNVPPDKKKTTAKAAGQSMEYKPHVAARIKEIIEQKATMINKAAVKAIARAAVDKEWVLRELVKNVRRAKVEKDFNAVNRSLELVGKELCMFIDRKEIRTGPLTNLTDEQLIELTAALDAGLPPGAIGVFGQTGNRTQDQGKPAEVLPAIH